jgi:hypothetical protein
LFYPVIDRLEGAMHKTLPAVAVVLCCALSGSAGAEPRNCDEGTPTTVTGTIGNIYLHEEDGLNPEIWIAGPSVGECYISIIELENGQTPASCAPGGTVNASGKVRWHDDFPILTEPENLKCQ